MTDIFRGETASQRAEQAPLARSGVTTQIRSFAAGSRVSNFCRPFTYFNGRFRRPARRLYVVMVESRHLLNRYSFDMGLGANQTKRERPDPD